MENIMPKKAVIAGTIVFLLIMANSINAYANVVLPAIANQFAVSFAFAGEGWWWSIVIGVLILIFM